MDTIKQEKKKTRMSMPADREGMQHVSTTICSIGKYKSRNVTFST
jgi:hypothetical protein